MPSYRFLDNAGGDEMMLKHSSQGDPAEPRAPGMTRRDALAWVAIPFTAALTFACSARERDAAANGPPRSRP